MISSPPLERPQVEATETRQMRSPVWPIRKVLIFSVSMMMICLVLSPIFQMWSQSPVDGFPLSYYPMFSSDRAGVVTVTYLIGFDARGGHYPVSYRYAGSGGFNQIRKQIRKTVGRGRAGNLCKKVAERIGRVESGIETRLTSIAIVTATFPLDEYMSGDMRPVAYQTVARYPVRRPTDRTESL